MSYSIAVISASGGAGRSTVSQCLARALAKQSGQKTVLVNLSGLQVGAGLSARCNGVTEYLAGTESLDSCTYQVEENFDCLSIGHLDPVEYPIFAKCLSAAKLQQLTAELAKEYHWIVFDSPAGFGALSQAILEATQFVIPLVEARPSGLANFWAVLRLLKHWQSAGPGQLRQLLGVLPTRVNHQCAVSRSTIAEIWSGITGLFDVMIPETTEFDQAILSAENGLIAFNSREMQRFQLLAIDVQNRIQSIEKEVSHESKQLVSSQSVAPQIV